MSWNAVKRAEEGEFPCSGAFCAAEQCCNKSEPDTM